MATSEWRSRVLSEERTVKLRPTVETAQGTALRAFQEVGAASAKVLRQGRACLSPEQKGGKWGRKRGVFSWLPFTEAGLTDPGNGLSGSLFISGKKYPLPVHGGLLWLMVPVPG